MYCWAFYLVCFYDKNDGSVSHRFVYTSDIDRTVELFRQQEPHLKVDSFEHRLPSELPNLFIVIRKEPPDFP